VRPSPARPKTRFEAVVFDWDGTAVADRASDAGALRARVESLVAASVDVVVVSGTNVGNVDGQLRARPRGPGHLYLALNRGSEVFAVGERGPELLHRREAGPAELAALDQAAARTLEWLASRGLRARVVTSRLNRRKIDLVPTPRWADPRKTEVARLLAAVTRRLRAKGVAGLAEVVDVARKAAAEAGLVDARVTSDAKHVEIGLTDKSDSMRWVLGELWRRGVGPGLVLVVGDEFGPLGGVPGSDARLLDPGGGRAVAVSVGVEPGGPPEGVLWLGGGPSMLLRLLDDQLELRRRRAVPRVDLDPDWSVALGREERDPSVQGSLFALGSGSLTVRGDLEDADARALRMALLPGVFGRGSDGMPSLLPGPSSTALGGDVTTPCLRILDLRTGVLVREPPGGEEGLRTARFVPLTAGNAVALRAEARGRTWPARALVDPDPGAFGALAPQLVARAGSDGTVDWAVTASGDVSIAAVACQETTESEGVSALERFAVYGAVRRGARRRRRLDRQLAAVREEGFDALLAAHRAAWASRWERADVVVHGDEAAQRALRFALFHLLSAAPPSGEAAVGARGATGLGYAGHVFWDADVFVLPALAATFPEGARSMIAYRLNRLEAARYEAAARGLPGARFPWESADSGRDVTPRRVRDWQGREVAIHTGEREEHINADVVWAMHHYRCWTGDDAVLEGRGRELVLDTARYWAARAEWDRDGRAHLRGVIGPDEYHELVDDNAYTNVMARWHLRYAAALARTGGASRRERERWQRLAAALVDGFDPASGGYEQFDGYFGLEPLLITEFAEPPVAADILLGRERLARSQVVKQADVLMAHHLVPGELHPGALAVDADFYLPRTAHGSSLSPAIHAAVLARLGRGDEALELFHLGCRIDLDDVTGTTAGGVHLAAMGGLWQAAVVGFAGIRPGEEALALDPALPDRWRQLDVCLHFRGQALRVEIAHDALVLRAERPVPVRVGRSPVAVGSTVHGTRSPAGWTRA